MKKRSKLIATTLIIAMILFMMNGCAKKESSSQNDDNTIYGQVTEVSESSVKIKIGTFDKGINLTDEEKEINISEDTKLVKEQMERPEMGKMGTPPDMPNSDSQDEGKGTPPDMPNGDTQDAGKGTPPDMPNGDAQDAGKGTPPDMPNGDTQDAGMGTPPDMPNSDTQDAGKGTPKDVSEDTRSEQEISISDISVGDIVEVELDDDGNATQITVISAQAAMNGSAGNMQNGGVDSYTVVKEYSSDTSVEKETIQSTGDDENAVLVSGGNTTLTNVKVDRTSSSSTGGDNSSFYGVGAAVLATNGNAYVSKSQIDTDAAGGAGLFAYSDGTIYAADTKISTTKDTSGGIHVAGGGSLYAWDLNVETNGQSSAAIRSDRGGGTIVVDGGSYTSNGKGSPAIYSTADITVNNATLSATGSEAICIEGFNSIRLFDTDLTGNMSDDSQNDCTWNVILYQSMSGDSEVGNSTFEMNGGSLTAKNGGMFYTTNTESTITLKDVDITSAKDSEFFLRCTGNNNQRGWGTTGQNGADCLFTAISQQVKGDVIWDTISKLDFYLTDKSSFDGAIINDETYAGDGGEGYCNVYIEKGSTWTVTGDSKLTNLYNAGTIKDSSGKMVTVKGTDGTVYVKGDSEYTITVNQYSKNADLSKVSKASEWSEYKTEKPEALK